MAGTFWTPCILRKAPGLTGDMPGIPDRIRLRVGKLLVWGARRPLPVLVGKQGSRACHRIELRYEDAELEAAI